jgi:hypothetical protein
MPSDKDLEVKIATDSSGVVEAIKLAALLTQRLCWSIILEKNWRLFVAGGILQ